MRKEIIINYKLKKADKHHEHHKIQKNNKEFFNLNA